MIVFGVASDLHLPILQSTVINTRCRATVSLTAGSASARGGLPARDGSFLRFIHSIRYIARQNLCRWSTALDSLVSPCELRCRCSPDRKSRALGTRPHREPLRLRPDDECEPDPSVAALRSSQLSSPARLSARLSARWRCARLPRGVSAARKSAAVERMRDGTIGEGAAEERPLPPPPPRRPPLGEPAVAG